MEKDLHPPPRDIFPDPLLAVRAQEPTPVAAMRTASTVLVWASPHVYLPKAILESNIGDPQ
jgi:hypothetical protein